MKTYSEAIKLNSFIERFNYLALGGNVAEATFGGRRYLNQMLYHTPEWRAIRRQIILRDFGCDLAHRDYEIFGHPFIHHIEPIDVDDIVQRRDKVFDPENLILVSFNTHQALHYGSTNLLPAELVVRKPNDTCPWKAVIDI